MHALPAKNPKPQQRCLEGVGPEVSPPNRGAPDRPAGLMECSPCLWRQEELIGLGEEVPAGTVELPAGAPGGALGTVLERSRALCLLRYEKELFTETSYLDAYARCQVALSPAQLGVFAGAPL
jgi:hypothetical protein